MPSRGVKQRKTKKHAVKNQENWLEKRGQGDANSWIEKLFKMQKEKK